MAPSQRPSCRLLLSLHRKCQCIAVHDAAHAGVDVIAAALPQLATRPCCLGAGKSCIVDRYIMGAFEQDVQNTVGTAFAAKRVRTNPCHAQCYIVLSS